MQSEGNSSHDPLNRAKWLSICQRIGKSITLLSVISVVLVDESRFVRDLFVPIRNIVYLI